MMNFVSKTRYCVSKIEEMCIRNDEFCPVSPLGEINRIECPDSSLRVKLSTQVIHLLIYQSPACFTDPSPDLSIAGMFY